MTFLFRAWRARPDLAAVLLLLAVAGPSRLLFLAADPPADVQHHYFWDEGLWAHNARVHELRGTWIADDHNPPLVLAPLYTVTLAATYSALGSSLATTRLVSAVAGILACLALYWLLRAVRAPLPSLWGALVLTASYFVVTHQRLGYTESYQLLWAVLAMGGVLWGVRDPRWALAGGASLALAQLVKPSALVLVPVILGFWLGEWWRSRRITGETGFRWAQVGWFTLGGLAVVAPLALLALPEWRMVWGYVQVSLRSAAGLAYTPRVELPGGFFRLPPTGLAFQSGVELAVVAALAWLRLLRAREDRADPVERLAWLWLGLGLLSIGLIQYQPDRRFLLLTPPLALLFATALARPPASGGTPRLRPDHETRPGLLRRIAAGAILGFTMGWVLVALGIERGGDLDLPRWPLLWSLALAGGSIGSALLPGRAVRRLAGVPLLLALPVFLLLEPVRYTRQLLTPSYTMRDATERLAALGRRLDPADRVLVGDPGSSLALASPILAIPIRDTRATGARMNVDAWERFHPALALETAPRKQAPADRGEAARRGFVPCLRFELLSAGRGVPFRRVDLWIRPDLAGHCTESP